MTRQREPIIVDVWRGQVVESRHQVVASVVDDRGAEVARYGDADFSTAAQGQGRDRSCEDHFDYRVGEAADPF